MSKVQFEPLQWAQGACKVETEQADFECAYVDVYAALGLDAFKPSTPAPSLTSSTFKEDATQCL